MKILKILKYKERIFPYIVGLLIFIHIFILLQLMFFPYPELFIYSYLTDKGLLPYKQIIDQHFPGVMFLPINLYSLGIDTLQEMRLVYFALIISSDLIFTKILKKIFNKHTFVLLGLLLYIFWQIYFEGHVLWIESFTTPLLLAAYYFMMDINDNGDYLKLYISVFLLGLSLVLKQTVMPLVGLLYLYLIYKKIPLKIVFYSVFLFSLPMSVVILYFLKTGIFKDFFFWTVTFNLTTFAQMGKTYPTLNNLIKTMPVFGTAALSILWLIRTRDLRIVLLTAVFLLGTLFFAYARFDYIHLQPALPFSIIIITLLISKLTNYVDFLLPNSSRLSLFAYRLLLVSYCLLSLYIFIPNFRFYNKPGVSPMFNDAETAVIVEKVKDYSNKGDTIFAFGTHPHIYYLTETMPPGNVFTFQFPWFMKVAEQTILTGIVNSPPKVVIRDLNAEVGGYSLAEYMQDIDQYIVENYVLVDYENNIEVLVKI